MESRTLDKRWALHTDNVLYALDDIYSICNQNGGQR